MLLILARKFVVGVDDAVVSLPLPFIGTVPRDFLLQVLYMSQFPQAPESIRAVSNFFENSRRYLQLEVHLRYQPQRYRWQNLLPVSLISVATLPPAVHLHLRISPRIFKKIWNDHKVIFRGLGEDDSWKKPETKNLVTLSHDELMPISEKKCSSSIACLKSYKPIFYEHTRSFDSY